MASVLAAQARAIQYSAKLYGQANAPHADRWKLPSLPMVQIQGHGKVCGHHGVADGVLSSSQDFAEWHTDGVHDVPLTTNPPAVTTMYCLDTPAQGGETLFASSREGFAALPERLKVRARRLECRTRRPISNDEPAGHARAALGGLRGGKGRDASDQPLAACDGRRGNRRRDTLLHRARVHAPPH